MATIPRDVPLPDACTCRLAYRQLPIVLVAVPVARPGKRARVRTVVRMCDAGDAAHARARTVMEQEVCAYFHVLRLPYLPAPKSRKQKDAIRDA